MLDTDNFTCIITLLGKLGDATYEFGRLTECATDSV
jgi:hypothetical protein